MSKLNCMFVEAGENDISLREIKDDLKTLQQMVGGFIQYVHLKHNIVAIMNEEGKIQELAPNILVIRDGEVLDFFAGNVLFLSYGIEGYESLSDGQIEYLSNALKSEKLIDGTMVFSMPI